MSVGKYRQGGTQLAYRSGDFIIALRRGIPWVHVNPLERTDQPSIYHLDEWGPILAIKDVARFDVLQGKEGSETAKPCTLMALIQSRFATVAHILQSSTCRCC